MMPRLRTIKPGFFTDDDLGECPPLARLLYAGLWCQADREGRLEDRPRRLKVEVLPYDDCDVDDLLNQLAQHGFIVRYAVNGARYIAIPKFLAHQNPHVKEAPSIIPAPGEHSTCLPISSDEHRASTVQALDEPSSFPAGVGSGEWGVVLGLGSGAGGTAGRAPPTRDHTEELERLHQLLLPFAKRGYDADAAFLRKLVKTYPHLDFELEAERLAEWLKEPRHAKERCNRRRILNWMEIAEERRLKHLAERETVTAPAAPAAPVAANGVKPYVPIPPPEMPVIDEEKSAIAKEAARKQLAEMRRASRQIGALPT